MTDQTTAALAEGLNNSLGTDYYRMRDIMTDDESKMLDRVRAFGEKEFLPIVNEYWEKGEFPFQVIDKLKELDINGPLISGYTESSAVAQGLIAYELGRLDGSIATFISVHAGLAMQSIYILGSKEQHERWLPEMDRMEKIGAFALTEPDHGSDSVGLETTCERDGDSWVINGLKRWPGNAVWCDIIIVFARDVEDKQVKAFVVYKDDPGYSATKIENKVALRMVQNADIVLDNIRVPDDRRLVNCNSFADVAKVLKETRNMVAWSSAGHAVAAYEAALTYAQRRKQFGRPIAKSQVIQAKLVEMLSETTAMQLYCIRLAQIMDEGNQTDTMAALAKYTCSVKARNVCRIARDILGGNGIVLDFHVIRHMNDMEALVTYEGTAEVQALIVGRHITGMGAFT